MSPSSTREKSPSASPKRRSYAEYACLNISPSFFSLNMGTGIASILLYTLPYNAPWLRRIGIVIFILNIVLFILFAILNMIRYVRWRGLFTAVNSHSQAGMSWGCLPMGFVTIINMVALVCVPAFGRKWAHFALVLWWIDVLVSIAANFGMLFMMFTRQTHTTITSAMLLPIVASVVAAASGGVVAQHLMPFDPHLARSTLICAYVIWGTGVPVAMFMITLWIYRLIMEGLPPQSSLPGCFLPLGPCGQGSYGILILGRVARDLGYTYGIAMAPNAPGSTLNIADAIYAGGIVTGLVLWGLGLVWYTLGMAITLDHGLRNLGFFKPKSFTISWTSYTFPIGVWATATTTLAQELDSPAFRVIGTVVSLQVVFQWLYVFLMTCYKAWNGTIYNAVELDKWESRQPPIRWAKKATCRGNPEVCIA
ncbi:voltage-dependent anion channel [Kockovaella imperatae]|uniref:Voltage-dependent anion channel n=1 Tax=Kockovaella imperatae TaxID=4999 RepID=A0A1Y1UEX5_9TREE|nr:voltage-dependent anion channel [Kockovaella imperatae]ORX36056.1 voltage-dependent anion channel [Kockovaella imperatae]